MRSLLGPISISILGAGGLTGCQPVPSIPALGPMQVSPRIQSPDASRYRLEAETKPVPGDLRQTYRTSYRLLERDTRGEEAEIWHDQRNERYGSHTISPEGTVWIATQGVAGPGGASLVWMRRKDDPRVSTVATQNLVFRDRSPSRSVSARELLDTSLEGAPDLSGATALRLGSGAEQLRFGRGDGREARLTWLDAAGTSQNAESGLSRFTIREERTGSPDPWTEALDGAPRPPSETDLKGAGALRFWTVGNRTLALRAQSGWFWEWPIRIESEEIIPAPVVGIHSVSSWLVWTRLDGEPKLQVAGRDGRIVRSFGLGKVGYPTAERLQRDVQIEDPRIWSYLSERRLADTDPRRESLKGADLRYPTRDGGRLVVTLDETDAPRLHRESAARTTARLLQREPDLPPGGALDERIVRSPSGAFRLRIRRRPSPWRTKPGERSTPQGYVVLLGRRKVGGESVEVEMGSYLFYGDAPVEARVFDDGRFATVEHHADRATLMLWNPDGSQISGIVLTQGWYPTVAQAKREFRIVGTSYQAEGPATIRQVAGVPVPETDSVVWTLPVSGGQRAVHLQRTHDGRTEVWYVVQKETARLSSATRSASGFFPAISNSEREERRH